MSQGRVPPDELESGYRVMDVESDQVPRREGFVGRLSSYAASGFRYWEPRRVVYNGALAVVVLVHFLLAWPSSRDKLSLDLLLVTRRSCEP